MKCLFLSHLRSVGFQSLFNAPVWRPDGQQSSGQILKVFTPAFYLQITASAKITQDGRSFS
jgi:hypothetical protein